MEEETKACDYTGSMFNGFDTCDHSQDIEECTECGALVDCQWRDNTHTKWHITLHIALTGCTKPAEDHTR